AVAVLVIALLVLVALLVLAARGALAGRLGVGGAWRSGVCSGRLRCLGRVLGGTLVRLPGRGLGGVCRRSDRGGAGRRRGRRAVAGRRSGECRCAVGAADQEDRGCG